MVLEAMACGRPVVATTVGAIASAVAHGYSGILVPPGDPVVLASALESLAIRPIRRERLGHNGRERVERDFELGRCTERLLRFLETTYA
ncbi:MAG: glycosyltransferase [Nitrospiria bacterium]